jgi:hypothetical protein
MKITEIRNLDLFKYSLVILTGSLVFIFFPFAFFLFHYKQAAKSTLQNIFYAFSCFGIAVLLLNSFLLFWILNSIVKSNNRDRIQQFETNFFQLLNYLHETSTILDKEMLQQVNHSIRNFMLDTKNTNVPAENTVQILMSSMRSSILKSEASTMAEQYFRQLNTLLVYIFSADHPLIDEEKYLALLETHIK